VLSLCAVQVGFLYLRYVADPRKLWGWLGPYCDDKEVRLKPTATQMNTRTIDRHSKTCPALLLLCTQTEQHSFEMGRCIKSRISLCETSQHAAIVLLVMA